MPSIKTRPSTFLEDIDTVSEDNLRSILRSLCDDPKTLKKAETHFTKLNTVRTTNSKKRGSESMTSVCVQCNESFNEEENASKSCQYHTGHREVDFESEVWEDMWEGDMKQTDFEDEGLVEEWPEGYRWTCCDEEGDHPGCRKGKHASKRDRGSSDEKSKKRKRSK
ncbi:hypothetical protein ABW19_dt0207080 [Dactylella cylindrospora]|nr:hypothetical protein ABW19_dt0207080 [Dactylella cylindrospora]